jgi:ribosomal protein L32
MRVWRTEDGMGETHGRRRLVAVLTIGSALLALTWLVAAFDTGGSSDPASASSVVILAVPVVVLLACAGLTWFVLARDADSGSDAESYVECGSCGRSILREWRLCPYCGVRTQSTPRAGEAANLVP